MSLQTKNGPISTDATGGNVDIRTQNGPIDLELSGITWYGSRLQAHTQNDPLSIHVTSGYKSGVLIQSSGHSPFSCHASVCSEGRKTWDNNNKRIEFGSWPTLVNASTVNGPISVKQFCRVKVAGNRRARPFPLYLRAMREAQADPDTYRHLVMCIADFSTYFSELSLDCRNDFI